MSQNKHAHPLKAAVYSVFVFLGVFFSFCSGISSDLGRWGGCNARRLLRCSAADIDRGLDVIGR